MGFTVGFAFAPPTTRNVYVEVYKVLEVKPEAPFAFTPVIINVSATVEVIDLPCRLISI